MNRQDRLCLLGFDQLFELGILTVGEKGTICARALASELVPIIEWRTGRRCIAFNDHTVAAFAAHRASGLGWAAPNSD